MDNLELPITILASDRASMQSQLDRAVEFAIQEARRSGDLGVLITRHDYRSFTVGLSRDVPFGMTLEEVAWRKYAKHSSTQKHQSTPSAR